MFKIRAITNLLLVAAVIFMSYYSSIVGINGETQASVSNGLSTDFTPAPYAFSIWGLIFVMLVVIAIKDIRLAFADSTDGEESFNCWLTVALVFTIAWTIVWSYLLIGWSLLVMAAIFVSLALAILRDKPRPVSANMTLALYFGWISVALVANESAWLVHLGWVADNGQGWLSDPSFSVMQSALSLVLFALVLSFKSIRKGLEPAVFVYPLVGVWAYIAIMVKNGAGNPNLLVYVSAFFALILLVVTGYFGTKWNANYSAKSKD
ncbi:hypothetical protein [Kangiella marina]|uniref:Tryptophan-rich sensory protein n=1 Tax=Kangiella marina TaxID=1079178 RepID=A0ABP8IKI2_9GAMM